MSAHQRAWVKVKLLPEGPRPYMLVSISEQALCPGHANRQAVTGESAGGHLGASKSVGRVVRATLGFSVEGRSTPLAAAFVVSASTKLVVYHEDGGDNDDDNDELAACGTTSAAIVTAVASVGGCIAISNDTELQVLSRRPSTKATFVKLTLSTLTPSYLSAIVSVIATIVSAVHSDDDIPSMSILNTTGAIPDCTSPGAIPECTPSGAIPDCTPSGAGDPVAVV